MATEIVQSVYISARPPRVTILTETSFFQLNWLIVFRARIISLWEKNKTNKKHIWELAASFWIFSFSGEFIGPNQ